MNYTEIFLAFIPLALAHFVALLSPGADFFILISNTSKGGKISGISTSFGISFGNLFYILLALFGISFIKSFQEIFILIKILGALYLVYIAFSLLRTKKRDIFSKNSKIERKVDISLKKSFYQGFLSSILNPKNSIFYFTLFSIAIKENTSFIVESFYAIWMFLAVLFWDIFIVNLLSSKKAKIFMQKYSNKIEKISGIILALIAFLILINIS